MPVQELTTASTLPASEVALPLAVLHRGLAGTVVRARRPRSVMRVAAISAMTSSSVAAVDSTAPVQVMSPTVRYRTLAS